MKSLYIVRHAKSDWAIDGLADIDRALNKRGYTDAHAMGKLLKAKNQIPQSFICSPAIRALSTGLIFSEELSFPKSEIKIEPSLYETNTTTYLNVLHSVNDALESVAIFGHNPIVSDLCSQWARKLIDMPTCAVVVFRILTDKWANVESETVEFVEMTFPKMI